MRALALAALLAATLAGCSGSDPSGPSASGPTFDDLGLQATRTTGVVRGIVVDEAIRPVAGVQVALTGGDGLREATSTAAGTFGFDGLAPGTHFVTASKPGYVTAQQSVEVAAGVAEPPVAKVQLQADAASMPYHEAYVFEGFIECSGTFVVVGAAVCSIPNLATEGTGAGNLTQDNFGVFYSLSKKPTWLQSEMVWDSTQALGGQMNLQYAWDCGETLLCEHEASGGSPLLLTAGPDAVDAINGGDYSEPLFVRAFNEGLAETQGLLGATVEQRFTVFTHAFYGYQPPEGWRVSDGGEVPQPTA